MAPPTVLENFFTYEEGQVKRQGRVTHKCTRIQY